MSFDQMNISQPKTMRRSICCILCAKRASQVIQVLKNLPANAKDINRYGFDSWVGKIPLEEGMATQPSIFAWRIPWTEESRGPQFIGSHSVGRY